MQGQDKKKELSAWDTWQLGPCRAVSSTVCTALGIHGPGERRWEARGNLRYSMQQGLLLLERAESGCALLSLLHLTNHPLSSKLVVRAGFNTDGVLKALGIQHRILQLHLTECPDQDAKALLPLCSLP